jgi:glutamate formiminotransferase
MPKIIECVPNISEGRNYRTIEKLANVIRVVEDVQLLDIHWDHDHNRSVFTFIGTPEGVFRAAYDLTAAAQELIDITQHEGVHPYLGAMDVIPFIPVKNATLTDCRALAQKLGAEIEKHLHIPVYFYEEATDDPKTKNLADLRAQSYNLKKHPKAGTTAIGARDYLVAYNVNLAAKHPEAAQKIAAKLRAKNGGLPGVKALGFVLKSRKQTQVSMNLVEPKRTSPKKVLEEIKKLAAKYRTDITGTELVGLLPEQVLAAANRF